MNSKNNQVLHNLLLIGAVVGALAGILVGVIIGFNSESLIVNGMWGLFYGVLAGIAFGSVLHAFKIKNQGVS